MYELYNNYSNNVDYTNVNTNWNIGIYCRLSREDDKDEFNRESESIDNQFKFLKGFITSRGWNVKKVYKDDGFTGTNFNRPGFQQMIADIESKKINMVVTKDLSRLGRDYIDTGYYIEKYFPSMNVRYIAVTDNVDTFDPNNTNNDMTPFKSVFNDMYAKDTSRKVRTILRTKAMNGESIKAFQPYGYKKDPNNKNKVIVDTNVSDIVVKIFQMYKSGSTKKGICDYLNESNITTPLKYKEETTNYRNPNKRFYIWSSSMISKILRDRIYIGDLVQHKQTKVNYKIKKTIKIDPSQYIIVPNNHEPIIDRETFNIVQEMLDKKSNEWSYSGNNSNHLLRGIVYCSCGGKVTYNKNHGKFSRCVCSSYKKAGAKFCNNIQYLKEDDLITMVLNNLRENVNKYLDESKLKYEVKQPEMIQDNSKVIEEQIKLIDNKIKNIYQDKLNNIITTELYMKKTKDCQKKKEELNFRLNDIEKEKKNKEEKIKTDNIEKYIKKVLEFNKNDEINREIILKLINKIVIENKKIKSICYNFSVPTN